MKSNVKIAVLLTEYLEKNPQIRFTQALFNLGINSFEEPVIRLGQPMSVPTLRDPYNDLDEVVEKKVYVNLMKLHEQEKRNNIGANRYNSL